MNQQLPLFHDGNVTYLAAPSPEPRPNLAGKWFWMDYHAEWWESTAPTLNWQPISLYRPYLDEGMSIASPVLLKDDTRWLYGSWVIGGWRRFDEGGSYPTEDFLPTHWAEPALDDAIMLSQE